MREYLSCRFFLFSPRHLHNYLKGKKMDKLGLIFLMSPALIGHTSRFLNGDEQRQLSQCCRRTQSLMQEVCKEFSLKQAPLLSHFLEKNVPKIRWCQVRYSLIGKPVVFSEQLYTSHSHGLEGRRSKGFTHERRRWIVSQIWTANGLQGTTDDLKGYDQFHVCQRQADGITCYKIPHGINEIYCLTTESGKTTVSSTLPHHQWKQIKLASVLDKR